MLQGTKCAKRFGHDILARNKSLPSPPVTPAKARLIGGYRSDFGYLASDAHTRLHVIGGVA